MTMLERVQRGRIPQPPRLFVYGTEGVGKSTFASQASEPIFIQTEDGLNEIECDKFPLSRSLDDVMQSLRELRETEHSYKTVVIDSADWLERLVWVSVCQAFGVQNIEKADGGYGKGYSHAVDYWRQILDLLDALRNDRHMLVMLIAHAKIERFEDPESSAYDRYSPRLHKNASALICEWCDAVLFATRKFRTQSEDTSFGRKRTTASAIGKAGGERVLRCVGGPACVAKNRYRISEELPLSWDAFVAALSSNSGKGGQNG